MSDHHVQIPVSIEIGEDDPMAAVVLEEVVCRYLDKGERRFLMIEHAAVARVVRGADIDIEPTVVVEVEDRVGHVSFVPRHSPEVVGFEPHRCVTGTVEHHVLLTVVDQQLAAVGAHARPPVANLARKEVDITIVVDVRAEGDCAVAAETKAFAVVRMIPVVLADDRRRANLVTAFGGWVVTAIAGSEFVVLPGEIPVIGVAGFDGSILEAHPPDLIDGTLPEMVGRPPVRWRHQLGNTIAVEVTSRRSPAMSVRQTGVEIVHAGPPFGLKAHVEGLVSESTAAVSLKDPILDRPHPARRLRNPEVDVAIAVEVDERRSGGRHEPTEVTIWLAFHEGEGSAPVVDHDLAGLIERCLTIAGSQPGERVQISIVVDVGKGGDGVRPTPITAVVAPHREQARGFGDVREAADAVVAEQPGVPRGLAGEVVSSGRPTANQQIHETVAVDVGQVEPRPLDTREAPRLGRLLESERTGSPDCPVVAHRIRHLDGTFRRLDVTCLMLSAHRSLEAAAMTFTIVFAGRALDVADDVVATAGVAARGLHVAALLLTADRTIRGAAMALAIVFAAQGAWYFTGDVGAEGLGVVVATAGECEEQQDRQESSHGAIIGHQLGARVNRRG